jgi:hypothetical protein
MSGFNGFIPSPTVPGALEADPGFAQAAQAGIQADPNAPQADKIPRELPDPSLARRRLVTRWQDRVTRGRKHFARDFERMKANTEFVLGAQWEEGKPLTGNEAKDNRYVANVALRHVQQTVATLYPTNPTVKFVAREKMIATVWDGDMTTLAAAQQKMQMDAQAQAIGLPPMPPDPQTMAVMRDFVAVQTYGKMIRRVGKTMEILWDYNVDEQVHPFKSMMKLTLRRAVITGVGYIKLGFQRAMKLSPEIENRIADMSERLATIERISADIADDKTDTDSAEAEQLRLSIQAMAADNQVVVREGLAFDYPDSWSLIPDPRCRSLKGFLGADWVAQEYLLSPDEVEEIYKVDVRKGYLAYAPDGLSPGGNAITTGHTKAGGTDNGTDSDRDGGRDMCCVWEIWSRKDGLVYTVCDGYPDFLLEPHPPETFCDAWWPWHVILFNEAYHAKRLFPLSNIDLIRDMQMEINRARQGLREQRQANRPAMVTAAGSMEQGDKDKIATRPANALIELNALQPGQKVDDLLQALEMPAIKPELYETAGAMEDMLRVLGNQAADTGSTSGATATEASLAEASQHSAQSSVMDDLDDVLSQLARNGGQIMLLNISAEVVNDVVGPGAVWPTLDKTTVAKNVYLEVEAGSSGRPNKQADIQNLVQLIPLLQRIPGVSPEWMSREILRRMDDRMDLTDAFAQGIPSMEQMNRGGMPGMGAGAGPPDAGGASDPSAQGAQGASNSQAGPPTNGMMRPRDLPTSAETMPQAGQPMGVQPTPGTGMATP